MSYYGCEYCSKKYTSKKIFDKHECEEKRRHDHLKTPAGLVAFGMYGKWLTERGFINRGKLQFSESRYYVSFVIFSNFVKQMALPGIDFFIAYMVELDVAPKDWSSNLVYDHYMEEFDRLVPPKVQASITVDTVFELANIFECEPDDVFLHLEANTLIKIVQAKKMSPWLLLFSPKFKEFVQGVMNLEQRVLLQQYVRADHWDAIFNVHPVEVDAMKVCVRALGI